ncbi:MAG: hypothetical protein FWD58_07175 [Firmicutes bacterium]|nr:hypothetical protein [Bacillota bacterium]
MIVGFGHQYHYEYDARGNVTDIETDITQTSIHTVNNVHYTYNGANQVETEEYKRNNLVDFSHRYEYNDRGQVKAIKDEPTGATLRSFSFDRLGRLETADGIAYTYNNYGNVAKIGSKTLSWDRRNLLTGYRENTQNRTNYSYNHQGVRFEKTVTANGNRTKITYLLDGSKILGENRNSTKLRYFYDATGIAGIRYNGVNYIYLKDALGNIAGIQSGENVICLYRYTAFGECTVLNPAGNPTSTGLNVIAYLNPFRWKSHYYDADTKLYYIDGRYYDPAICQFITADAPENLPALAGVVYGLNRYGITVDNAVALVGALYNIFSETGLVPDPSYEGYSGGGGGSSGGNWWTRLPNWSKWVIGAGVIVVLAAATVITAGAAGITLGSAIGAGFGATLMTTAGVAATGAAATAVGILSAATAGAIIGGVMGATFGGITGGWNGAASGFAMGAITGGITGAASQGLTSVHQFGVAAAKAGTLSAGAKFGYGVANYGIQMLGNAAVNATVSIAQQAIFGGSINWSKVRFAALFGGLAGGTYLWKGPSVGISMFGLTGLEELLGIWF